DAVGGNTGPGTAGGDGVHQVDGAMAVEHDRFTGMGIDSHDEHRPLRPALTGQPRDDHGAPLPLPGAAPSRSPFERRRTHPAAPIRGRMSAASSAAPMIPLVLPRRPATGTSGTRPPPGPAGPVCGWGAAARMLASSSSGRVALVIWAAAVDPADVPMIRSAP